MILSKLEGFSNPKPELEQYRTPGNVAADLLWMAMEDIVGKVVADLGAGTGVLGIGACLTGAREVYAVEIDPKALEVLKRNASSMGVLERIRIIKGDVSGFSKKVDTVVMNPPFGAQRPHSDRAFLSKAFEIADVVYSLHLAKWEVRRFVRSFAMDHSFRATILKSVSFEIPAIFHFHRKRIERINVDVYRFEHV